MKIMNTSVKLVEALMALALAVMVVLVLGNVILRYGFNSGIAESEDIARFLFIWMTFIGAVLGVRERAHLGMDAIVKLLPRSGKRLFALVSHVLMLAVTGMFLVGCWAQMRQNTDVMAMGAVEYPLSWMYASGFVGSLGMIFFLLRNLAGILKGSLSDEDLVMVQEQEGLGEVEHIAAAAAQAAGTTTTTTTLREQQS